MGRDVLILERGYIGDRFSYTSIGWNGLNGYARFPHYADDGGDRFSRMGVEIEDWNPHGEYVLLIGQVKGDASLRGQNLRHWYADTARHARTVYNLPVRFRPHPEELKRGHSTTVAGCETDLGKLRDALMGAAVVVTFNSNTAVESVLAGKPTVCMDAGSMAWTVCAHSLGDAPPRAREAWAHALAWKQWTLDEIRNGDALIGIVNELKHGALHYG